MDIKSQIVKYFGEMITYKELINYAVLLIKSVLIFIITRIFVKIFSSIIEKFFERQKNSRFGINNRRADTLSELLKSIIRYVMYFIAIVWILDVLGFEIKTVLAVTSVAGVAIGFGAQNLVKDVITGFFILFEDQFAVGDFIEIDGMTGIVEALGLRITKIRDFSGDLHIVPNGSIVKVTNKSRGSMRALVDVDIAYEENTDKVIAIINKVLEDIKKEKQDIVEGPNVLGITKFGEAGTTIRIIARTNPMGQWDVEMEIRRRIKAALEKNGIHIQYPTRILVENKKEV